jgi:hypothetical protein
LAKVKIQWKWAKTFYNIGQRGGIGDPFIYWQTPVLGYKFNYEIDVSNVGCRCNVAAYFSQLPGYNIGQQPEPGPGKLLVCTFVPK